MATAVQDILRIVLRYQRLKANGEDSSNLRRLADEVEPMIESLWHQLAALHALRMPSWKADNENPGYVLVPMSEKNDDVICVPFHLVPARPDVEILQEIIKIASQITLGNVGDRNATICLSGSTLVLKDVIKVGDIDFCEYIPAEIPASVLAEAVKNQVRAHHVRQCAVSIRIKNQGGGSDELMFISITPRAEFTPEQLEKVRVLLERAKNGQTYHLVETTFGGVMEATNCLIIFRDPLESDPVAALSFAHQEASLGIYGNRPLHTVEAIAAYLSFLRAEIGKYSSSNPVKAFKRAIPWLRLFGDKELLGELKDAALRFRATEAASILAKMDLLGKYERMEELNPTLRGLVDRLRLELVESVREMEGENPNPANALHQRIVQFGRECINESGVTMGRLPLWDRILSLADEKLNR